MMLIALQCGKEWTNRLLAAARDMPWCQLATGFVQAPCAVIRDGLADTSVSLYPQNKDIPLFLSVPGKHLLLQIPMQNMSFPPMLRRRASSATSAHCWPILPGSSFLKSSACGK